MGWKLWTLIALQCLVTKISKNSNLQVMMAEVIVMQPIPANDGCTDWRLLPEKTELP